VPEELRAQFEAVQQNTRGFDVQKRFYYQSGAHPRNHIDFECAFAAQQLLRERPGEVLDIGSYRQFIIGLLGRGPLTTLDVRERMPECATETVLTADARSLPIPDASLDAIVSLCAIEHFGLGRYGDPFDLEGDLKAFREMRRVIRPGGVIIFTTTITQGRPTIWFNAHRIYSRAMLNEFLDGMTKVEEVFFNPASGKTIGESEITYGPEWDIYAGCWRNGSATR
jgi:SAM-dependent methyltransferase